MTHRSIVRTIHGTRAYGKYGNSQKVIGLCRLCLAPDIDLQDSHFIPSAAYKAVEELGGVTPLIVKGDITIQKNQQLKKHLLCADCEDRFNKNGEQWVLGYCNRAGKGFRLYGL